MQKETAMPSPCRHRNQLHYAAVCLVVVGLGLASRRLPRTWPVVWSKYPGDALWALMVFFGLGAVFRRASTLQVAAGALGFSSAIEVLKLWQAPWLAAVRHTTLGHLVFGHAFSWQNLAAYLVGVLLGVAGEAMADRARSKPV